MWIIHASLGILSLPVIITHFIFTLQIHELVTKRNDYSFSLYVYICLCLVAWERHTNTVVQKYDQSLAPWNCRKHHLHARLTFNHRMCNVKHRCPNLKIHNFIFINLLSYDLALSMSRDLAIAMSMLKYRIHPALWCVDENIKKTHRLILMDYTGQSMWWSSGNLLCPIGFNICQHGTLVPVQNFSGRCVYRFWTKYGHLPLVCIICKQRDICSSFVFVYSNCWMQNYSYQCHCDIYKVLFFVD